MPKVTPLRADDPGHVGQHRLTGRISGMPGPGPFYLARAPDGTAVTLQLLSGSWTRDAAARDRFAAEAGAARRVPGTCAARILDAGVAGDHAYLVSEYVPGPSVLELAAQGRWAGGAELEALALGSAAGLAAVHQAGLVHGAFGPDHIICSASGPQVIEFGITPPYGTATPAADMMAWAQTMVFAVIGRPPAALADLDALPGRLRESVAACLAGDPALRPAARDIVAGLLGEPGPGPATLARGASRAAGLYQSAHPPPGDDLAGGPGGELAGLGDRAHRAPQRARQHRSPRGEPDSGARGTGAAGPARGARRARARLAGARLRQAWLRRVRLRRVRLAGPGGHRPAGHLPGGAHQQARGRGGSGPRRATAPPAGGGAPGPPRPPPRWSSPPPWSSCTCCRAAAGSGQAADRAPGGVTRSQSASPTASAPPAAPATVPSSFAGTWSGQAKQLNPADVFDVRVSLAAGTGAGRVSYSSATFTCAGQLSLQDSTHSRLTLSQGIIHGRHTCANGTVTLSADAEGTLVFSFRGKTGPAASGTLTRG